MFFKDKTKLAIFFLVISIILLLVNSFLITNPEINNADPTSYIIVPIVMLPLFAIFTYKNKLIPKLKKEDILLGICGFALFVALIIGSELAFPYFFLSYRADMLLLPIGITSIIAILFGIKNVKAFWPLLVYPIIASPVIFLPVAGLNNAFAQLNTIFVYNVLHIFSQNISYVAPFSISTASYTIGIGTACAGIAVFIALILFLAPIAYLLDGSSKNKVYWLISGFLLLVLLNFLRMTGIALIWLTYGPNATVSFVHSFAGILLFYAAMIVMVLIARRYGLEFKGNRQEKVHKRKSEKLERISQVVAVALSLGYLFVSLNYASQFIVPIQFNSAQYNFTSQSLIAFAGNFSNAHGWNYSAVDINSTNRGILIISNQTFNSTNPLVMLLSETNQTLTKDLLANSTMIAKYNFVDEKVIPSTLYELNSNSTIFFVAIKNVPYLFPNNYYAISTTYLIMPESAGGLNLSCAAKYDTLYTLLDNIGLSQSVNQAQMQQLQSAYCISENFV